MIHVVLKDGTSICSCFISVLQRSFRIVRVFGGMQQIPFWIGKA